MGCKRGDDEKRSSFCSYIQFFYLFRAVPCTGEHGVRGTSLSDGHSGDAHFMVPSGKSNAESLENIKSSQRNLVLCHALCTLSEGFFRWRFCCKQK